MSRPERGRFAIFVDAAVRRSADGRLFCGNEVVGFMRFANAVGRHFESFTVIARQSSDRARTPHPMPGRPLLAPLPHYPSLRDLGAVLAALPRTVVGLWRSLDRVDLVWVSAGHPFGLLLLIFAVLRGRRAAILVRQDSVSYFRTRLPGRAWAPLLGPLWLVDRAFRFAARWLPVTAVGDSLAADYGAPRPNVLAFTVNLVSLDRIAERPADGDWSGEVELLTVGRIEPEKAPDLLVEALARLQDEAPGRFRLTWVGDGRLRGRVKQLVQSRGLTGRVDLPGFIPFGPRLDERYRRADAFIHAALTEGLPQVLSEAMAAGLPIAATDVGGVRAALGDQPAGLLMPPGDPGAIVDAVLRLAADAGLRARLAETGLTRARATALETESERVAGFLAAG